MGRQSTCELCPRGKYAEKVTGQCLDCSDGKWSNLVDVTLCNDCPSLAIVKCPSGSIVPFVISGGVFRSLEAPAVILPCVPAEACQLTGLNDTICAAGYEGSQCSQCQNEYFRNSGRCVKCMPKTLRQFIVIATALVVFFGIAKLSERQSLIPTSFRLMLFWLQFVSILPSLSDSWPTLLFSILSITALANIDIGYLGIGCDLKSQYLTVLVLKILMPIFVGGFLAAQNLVMLLLRRTRRMEWMKVFSNTVFILNFFVIQIGSAILQIFSCREFGDGLFVLRQNPTTRCYNTEWSRFVAFSMTFFCIYVVALPLFLVWLFRRAKSKNDHEVLEVVFGPLIAKQRPGCEWFVIVKFVFRLIVVMTRDLLSVSSSAKSIILGIFLLVFLWMETISMPYTKSSHQHFSLL
jgi:hypothetical protein